MRAAKKISILTAALALCASNTYAMTTNDFDAGMAKGINYYNQAMYYEARDEFQWFADYNWGYMNEGQQKYLLDYLDGAKANIQNLYNQYNVYNGEYCGGGFQVPGETYKIGRWYVTINDTTVSTMRLSLGQSESDFQVDDVILYRCNDGSYYGVGKSSWGTSYITAWLETPQRIYVSVSGAADQVGGEYLYK